MAILWRTGLPFRRSTVDTPIRPRASFSNLRKRNFWHKVVNKWSKVMPTERQMSSYIFVISTRFWLTLVEKWLIHSQGGGGLEGGGAYSRGVADWRFYGVAECLGYDSVGSRLLSCPPKHRLVFEIRNYRSHVCCRILVIRWHSLPGCLLVVALYNVTCGFAW